MCAKPVGVWNRLWGWWVETPSCPLWRHCTGNGQAISSVQWNNPVVSMWILPGRGHGAHTTPDRSRFQHWNFHRPHFLMITSPPPLFPNFTAPISRPQLVNSGFTVIPYSLESKNWTILHIFYYLIYHRHFHTSQNFTAPISFGNFDRPRFLEVGRTYVPKFLRECAPGDLETNHVNPLSTCSAIVLYICFWCLPFVFPI